MAGSWANRNLVSRNFNLLTPVMFVSLCSLSVRARPTFFQHFLFICSFILTEYKYFHCTLTYIQKFLHCIQLFQYVSRNTEGWFLNLGNFIQNSFIYVLFQFLIRLVVMCHINGVKIKSFRVIHVWEPDSSLTLKSGMNVATFSTLINA